MSVLLVKRKMLKHASLSFFFSNLLSCYFCIYTFVQYAIVNINLIKEVSKNLHIKSNNVRHVFFLI